MRKPPETHALATVLHAKRHAASVADAIAQVDEAGTSILSREKSMLSVEGKAAAAATATAGDGAVGRRDGSKRGTKPSTRTPSSGSGRSSQGTKPCHADDVSSRLRS